LAVAANVTDSVRAPVEPSLDALREQFFATARRWSLGLVSGGRWRLAFGPLTLLRFGDPQPDGHGWSWPIEGGLIAAAPGGRLRVRWDDGILSVSVEGYRPLLPEALYRALQVPVHHLTTRLFMLTLRGRNPPPGKPATPEQRVLTRVIDIGACVILLRRRRLRSALLLAGAYHVAAWGLGGVTLGGLIAGTRVIAADGSALSPAQALVKLVAGDDIAGTDVVSLR
jgi:hypothetical protein